MRTALQEATAYAPALALRCLIAFFGIFPIEANLVTMRAVGWVWFTGPHAVPAMRLPLSLGRWRWLRFLFKVEATWNKLRSRLQEHRNRAERHIRTSFPEMDAAAVSRIALGSMQQLTMLAMEVLLTPQLITQWSWARHIELRELSESVRVLLGRKGCIMLTGHYGNWELLGYSLARLGFDIVAVMRPLDNEHLNRVLLDRRERSGLRLLYKKGMTQSAGDVIESGGALCFIADQNAGSKGLFVDFFGRKASTYKSIGLLAMEHDVPIIVGCARRIEPRRFRYEIDVNRIIRPEEWQGRDDPLRWITEEYSRALENLIRVAPEQYLWIHRRWKSRPKDEMKKSEERESKLDTATIVDSD